MTAKSSPKLRFTPFDAIVIAVIVGLAVLAAVLFYGGKVGGDALTAVITHRGQEIERIDLDALHEDQTIEIDGTYHLTITMTPDGIAVTKTDCPTQDCLHTGTIRRAGQTIVCLPEQVVISLEGTTGGADVVLG